MNELEVMVTRANAYLARNQPKREVEVTDDIDSLVIRWIRCGHKTTVPRAFLDVPMSLQAPGMIQAVVEKQCQLCAGMKRLANEMPAISAANKKY